jgi:hypothetical protein
MRKGLTVTLLTVAIALIGYHAMATAPVIDQIPDIVVGDAEDGSPSNVFVYPDVLNLNSYVTDDGGDDAIIWSFLESSGTYTVNSVASLDSADPIDPGALAIAGPGVTTTDPKDVDSNPKTITIRNETLSPIAGGPTYPDPAGGPGILPSMTKVMTLFASDGETVTQSNDFMVYSDDEGQDRLSFGGAVPTPVQNIDFSTAGASGWAFSTEYGTVTSSLVGGLCLEVALTGVQSGAWASPYGFIELADNAVWQVRVGVTTDVTSVGTTPLWDIVSQNFGPDETPQKGQFAYGGDYYFLDNVGGANSPISGVGLTEFELWFTVPPAKAEQWRSTTTGAFTTARDPDNDMRLLFRTIDVDGVGYGGELDAGELCLADINVTRYSLGDMAVNSTVYERTTMVDGTQAGQADNGFLVSDIIGGGTEDWTGGNLTLSPPSGGWDIEITTVVPGDDDFTFTESPAVNELPDNFPITWNDDELLVVIYELSAPNATGESNPSDQIRIGMDGPTNELIQLNFVTGRFDTAAMPKQGTPQEYWTFFHTNAATLDSAGRTILRPRFELLNSNAWNETGTTATGGTTIHSVKVQKVSFQ